MTWEKPLVDDTPKKINQAGNILISSTTSAQEKDVALGVLNHWRAVHSYPMHVFKIRLKRTAERVDRSALTVQRLKRVPAIIYKLKRDYPNRPNRIKLFEMQDIAGCRAVLPNVELARELAEKYYIKGELKHKRVKINDYISNPKETGYRSYHIIYEYRSDKENKKEYNGLLIEIQIRSKLQHLWATAIETVDFFTRQAIKTSEGDKEWMDFFKLVSSAFAKMEGCNPVPNTPTNEKELYSQIMEREKELNVIEKMKSWAELIKTIGDIKQNANIKVYLLELDIVGERLIVTGYTKGEEEKAIREYAEAEKRYAGQKQYDVVLVGAENVNDLKKAYPNYFVDTKEFLRNLRKVIDKAGKTYNT